MDFVGSKLWIISYVIILFAGKSTQSPLYVSGPANLRDNVELENNGYNHTDAAHLNLADDKILASETDEKILDDKADGQFQADSVGLDEPTSRIIVTVMKRSRRFWEPWELNYSE